MTGPGKRGRTPALCTPLVIVCFCHTLLFETLVCLFLFLPRTTRSSFFFSLSPVLTSLAEPTATAQSSMEINSWTNASGHAGNKRKREGFPDYQQGPYAPIPPLVGRRPANSCGLRVPRNDKPTGSKKRRKKRKRKELRSCATFDRLYPR